MNININKIVIVVGFLGSILGIIVAFYPTIFNLEKKKINQLMIQVSNLKDVDKIDNFLMENRGEIVYLDVSICNLIESNSIGSSVISTCPIFTVNKKETRPNYDGYSSDAFSVKCAVFDEEGKQPCNCQSNNYSDGIAFYFDKHNWGWEKYGECKIPEVTGLWSMSGYFLVPHGFGFGFGISEWMLVSIDSKEITLKDY